MHIASTESKSFRAIVRKLAFGHLEASFLNYIITAEGADALNELRLQMRGWCFAQQSNGFSKLRILKLNAKLSLKN